MKLIIQNNKIIAVAIDEYDGADAIGAPDDFDFNRVAEYTYDGSNFTLPLISADINTNVQNYLDTFVQQKGYDSIVSAVSYIASSNTVYQSDANTAIHARDTVWSAVFNEIAQLTANNITVNSYSQIANSLPALTWSN